VRRPFRVADQPVQRVRQREYQEGVIFFHRSCGK
jgi:hypothetical protein